jgi:hypothetical protein
MERPDVKSRFQSECLRITRKSSLKVGPKKFEDWLEIFEKHARGFEEIAPLL